MIHISRILFIGALFAAFLLGICSSATATPPSEVLMTLSWSLGDNDYLSTAPGIITLTESFDVDPTNPDNPLSYINATVRTNLNSPEIELFNTVEYSQGSTGGSLRYYFTVADVDGYPNDFEIPIMFASKAKVVADPLVTQGESEYAAVHAEIALAIGFSSQGKDYLLGTVDQLRAWSNEDRIEKEKTFINNHDFNPGEQGWVSLTATASVFRAGSQYGVIDGAAYAYIDPMIYVDPNFMVEHEGRMVPGSEIFSITFSEGIVNVPNLPNAKSFNWGMFLPAIIGTQE